LDELRGVYDAVVLATGLPADRRLGIPGEDLPGVIGAGALTRPWSSHPEAPAPAIGKRVVVLGMGNVAADIVRILAKTPEEFDGSDLCPDRTAALTAAGVQTIDVVARGPADTARIDPVMLRELGRLEAARIRVDGLPGGEDKLAEAFAAIDGHAPAGVRRMLTFRFGWTPERITGTEAATGVAFAATDGSGRAMGLPCDTVITAIGFSEDPALPRDALLARPSDDGCLAPGLYAAGWFRRGPRGTIPDNRADALAIAARIAADLAPSFGDRPGRAALGARLPDAIPYSGWQRIDAAERAEAPEGRCRRKVDTLDRMLTLARQEGA
jgi:ferredoxin--NADP+ reductase